MVLCRYAWPFQCLKCHYISLIFLINCIEISGKQKAKFFSWRARESIDAISTVLHKPADPFELLETANLSDMKIRLTEYSKVMSLQSSQLQ